MRKDRYYNQFIFKERSNYSIIINDDGIVAYAYLLDGENIISDLWIYNSSVQLYKDWNNITEEDLPLQNLDQYILKKIDLLQEEDIVKVDWFFNNQYIKATIYINNTLIGYLDNIDTVGYSTLVNQDTPIAKKYIR